MVAADRGRTHNITTHRWGCSEIKMRQMMTPLLLPLLLLLVAVAVSAEDSLEIAVLNKEIKIVGSTFMTPFLTQAIIAYKLLRPDVE